MEEPFTPIRNCGGYGSPSTHYEIRLSLSQLCGVRTEKPPQQLLSSGQRAPQSFGVESLSSRPPHPTVAQHRGLAPSWCRHDAADRVAKAASDGFVLVEVGETVDLIAATAACGRQPSARRPTRFTSCSMGAQPLSLPPISYVSTAHASVNLESLLVGGEAVHDVRRCHQPCPSNQQKKTLLVLFQALLNLPSSQGGGASAMLVFDVQIAVDENDDVHRPYPSVGSSSARDDNPRIVRHVSQVAQVRETSPKSPVTQERADRSSVELDTSTYLETRVTPSLPV